MSKIYYIHADQIYIFCRKFSEGEKGIVVKGEDIVAISSCPVAANRIIKVWIPKDRILYVVEAKVEKKEK